MQGTKTDVVQPFHRSLSQALCAGTTTSPYLRVFTLEHGLPCCPTRSMWHLPHHQNSLITATDAKGNVIVRLSHREKMTNAVFIDCKLSKAIPVIVQPSTSGHLQDMYIVTAQTCFPLCSVGMHRVRRYPPQSSNRKHSTQGTKLM